MSEPDHRTSATFIWASLMGILTLAIACADKKSDIVAGEQHDSVFVQAGDRIIAASFDTLRNSLLAAIRADGFPGAITFCNERATLLTAVYADSVTVRRTALRYRNPANAPDSLEQVVLEAWNADVSMGRSPQPELLRRSDGIHYFKPIFMQALCTNCHGTPQKDIQLQTSTTIRRHYPKDQAVNFAEGDLRGSWHLVFTTAGAGED